jgi:H+/Cl- antiporter ClcA
VFGRLVRRVEDLRRREDQLALVLSLLIGALVGLVVVAFILLTGRLAARMYPPGGSGWRRVIVPTLGSLVTGFLLYRYFPLARGSGIPQTKSALFIQEGRISFRTVLGKFFCCSASLASGIALGREGPAVHIGAGLASVIARRLRMSRDQVRALVPVGGAAALAAAFNTPIAAVLFSLEEIMGDLHAPILGSVVLSSATAWMVLHLVLGDEPLFHVTAYHLVNPLEFGAYAVLGVVGGLGSVAFVKLLLRLRQWFLDQDPKTRWIQPVAGGLTVGLMGYFLPEILGVGYAQVERALAGDMLLRTVAVLAVLKIVATAVCYASGNAGGIFGPSLFIGAMMGASVGSVAHLLFPESTAGPGAYALVGMGTAFAGIVRTPSRPGRSCWPSCCRSSRRRRRTTPRASGSPSCSCRRARRRARPRSSRSWSARTAMMPPPMRAWAKPSSSRAATVRPGGLSPPRWRSGREIRASPGGWICANGSWRSIPPSGASGSGRNTPAVWPCWGSRWRRRIAAPSREAVHPSRRCSTARGPRSPGRCPLVRRRTRRWMRR